MGEGEGNRTSDVPDDQKVEMGDGREGATLGGSAGQAAGGGEREMLKIIGVTWEEGRRKEKFRTKENAKNPKLG